MAALRDLVRFLPNERGDLPDFEALQRNNRSDIRSQFKSLLYGTKSAAADLKKVIAGFTVTEDGGGASSQIDITNGVATGAENLPDSSLEYGTFCGPETQTTQSLDFTGQPNGTYSVYVRFSATPGTAATRVFWNATTLQEDTDVMETRYVVDWDVVYGTVSPGDEYIEIAEVVWGGVTVVNANITDKRDLFFEGEPSGGYAHNWGDGANDRNSDRKTYGVFDFYTWVHAMRRQMADVIGASPNGWYTQPPTDLLATSNHIADSSDPHGSVLTQTDLVLSGKLRNVAAINLRDNGDTDYVVIEEIIGADQLFNGWFSLNQTGAAPLVQLNGDFDSTGKLAYAVVGVGSASTSTSYVTLPIVGCPALGGGEIREIQIHGRQVVSGTPTDITVRVVAVDINNGSRTTLGSATIDTTAINSTQDFTVSSGAITAALATEANYYQLEIEGDHTPAAASSTGLFSVQINYSRPRLFST